MGLVEVTNLHYRELVDGFLEGKTVQDTFSDISRDSTLSHAYLDKLKSIYTSPVYRDWSESHPLRDRKLKKDIIDAWVEEWQRMNLAKPTERSIVADITSLLPQLSEGWTAQGPRPRSALRSLCIAGRGLMVPISKTSESAINTTSDGSKR